MLGPRFVLVLLLLPATESEAQSHADFSGVDRFWPIVQHLSADSEPSASEWRQLLDAPAYRQLERDTRLQRLFRLTYQPSAQRQRDSILATTSFDAVVIRHLQRVPQLGEPLQRLRDSLALVDLVGQASALAAAYLPAGEIARRPPPVIAFGLFGPEAYGASNGITMDLLFAFDRGPHFLPIVAHEVHHVHVAHLTRLRFPERTAPEFTLLQALRNLANEGTADRINLRFPVSPPAMTPAAAPAYNAAYAAADSTLRIVDSLLTGMNGDTAKVRRAGVEMSRVLVYAGHPVGARMAERIEERLGRTRLIAAVGNPFAFFRLYSEAAASLPNGRPFAPATLDAVAELERTFYQ